MLERLGPFEVSRELGRGGMGVVYLARDTRLDREVAIKALPEHLAADPDRLARFEREAKTLAQLNHPNLAGIYGVEEQDGRRYLVLEYVEGETLADRIRRGRIPIDDAIELAVQIASGVEAAHEAGVIHRDLKPDNIRITPDGKVKVLDFGLARSEAVAHGDDLDSPTLTTPQASPTIPGAILGTAPYMSPEQARGKPIDKRTDIWSFGVVLYEMLTGEGPFAGETVTDSLGAILHKQIDLQRLPHETPPHVRRVIRRCLQRERSQRYQHIGDVRIELPDAPESDLAPAVQRSDRSLRHIIIVSILSLVGFLLGVSLSRFPSSPPTAPATGSEAPVATAFQRISNTNAPDEHPSLSPDAQTIAYSALTPETGTRDILSVRVGGDITVNLTSTFTDSNEFEPAFSPDGPRIAFRSDRAGGGIWIMGASGENPRRLTDFGANPSWSPGGDKVVFADAPVEHPRSRQTPSTLWIADIATGTTTRLDIPEAVQPAWSPDGKYIAYWGAVEGGNREIFVTPVAGGEVTRIAGDDALDWSPVWAPGAAGLFFISNRDGSWNIWHAPFDPATGRQAGEPTPVTRSPGSRIEYLSASADGSRLAFSVGSIQSTLYEIMIDPDGPAGQTVDAQPIMGFSEQLISYVKPSPTGLMPIVILDDGVEDLAILDLATRQLRKITSDPYNDRGAVFSPSGDEIAFYSDRSGTYEIWTIRPDGSRLTRAYSRPDKTGCYLPFYSPDGNILTFNTLEFDIVAVERTDDGWSTEAQVIYEQVGGAELFSPYEWSSDKKYLFGAWGSFVTADSVSPAWLDVGSKTLVVLDGIVGSAFFLPPPQQPASEGTSTARALVIDARTGTVLICPLEGEPCREIATLPLLVGTDSPWFDFDERSNRIYYSSDHKSAHIWTVDLRTTSSSQ